jgi:hypothetical protein
VQDAFGLAHYRFDETSKRVVAIAGGNGKPAPAPVNANGQPATTNVVVLRAGEVYFEGSTDDVLHSSDDYLKKFLASAE